ncbi:MAG: DNA-binding protein [Desulfobacterales bacterium]|jgi:predicted DNA-binding protein with PD1-like motif
MEVLGRYQVKDIIAVKIEPGVCIQAALEKVVENEGGNALILTAVGSIAKLAFANPKASLDKEDINISINEKEGPFELISLIGGVGPIHAHGKGNSHLHIAVSSHDGHVIGGGLRYGTEPWFPVQVQLLLHE